jgi:hypothetical protein
MFKMSSGGSSPLRKLFSRPKSSETRASSRSSVENSNASKTPSSANTTPDNFSSDKLYDTRHLAKEHPASQPPNEQRVAPDIALSRQKITNRKRKRPNSQNQPISEPMPNSHNNGVAPYPTTPPQLAKKARYEAPNTPINTNPNVARGTEGNRQLEAYKATLKNDSILVAPAPLRGIENGPSSIGEKKASFLDKSDDQIIADLKTPDPDERIFNAHQRTIEKLKQRPQTENKSTGYSPYSNPSVAGGGTHYGMDELFMLAAKPSQNHISPNYDNTHLYGPGTYHPASSIPYRETYSPKPAQNHYSANGYPQEFTRSNLPLPPMKATPMGPLTGGNTAGKSAAQRRIEAEEHYYGSTPKEASQSDGTDFYYL